MNNSEIDHAYFSNLLSDLRKEFAARFQYFADREVVAILKMTFWSFSSGRMFLFRLSNPLLQIKIIDMQEDVSLQIYKTALAENF